MAREGFLLSLEIAADYPSSWRAKNGVRLDSESVADHFRRDPFTCWLSRRTVEGFLPADYEGILSEEELERLKADVSSFSRVAQTLDPKQPATEQQIESGLPHFLSILKTMSPFLEGFKEYQALKDADLRPYIKDFAVFVCDDWTGDPAIKIWVIVDDDIVKDESFYNQVSKLDNEIRAALEPLNLDRYPYIQYRTETHQRELEEAIGC